MKKAVIYARYSCDSQTEQSIEGQLRVCHDYAKNNNILVVDTYIDRAMTGTNDNRAAFQKMLKDSEKKQWQYILVYKLDRFSRNKFESVIHKKALRDHGVVILSAMENISDTPEGRMMETILEGFNQYYSEELTQKVIRGFKESWSKGQTTGGKPLFGYDIVDKRCVINEYEAGIVREAFTKYSQGFQAVSIVREFKEKGYRRKNGKSIDENYLYTMLHDIRYTGIVEHQGVVYDKIYPRIIPDDLWKAVSAITEENKISPSRKKEARGFILSGKLICGKCKHRMVGISGTSHTGIAYQYYACQSDRYGEKRKCATKPIRKKHLEDLVIDTTTQILRSSAFIHTLAETIYAAHQNATADNTALKLLEQKRKDVLTAKNNVIKAIEQGIITETTKSRLTELEAELNAIESEIAHERTHNYAFLTVKQIELYLSSFVFENSNEESAKKILINTFVREILVYESEIVITYNFFDNPENLKVKKNYVRQEEKQIEQADSSYYLPSGSSNLISFPPKRDVRATSAGAPFWWDLRVQLEPLVFAQFLREYSIPAIRKSCPFPKSRAGIGR